MHQKRFGQRDLTIAIVGRRNAYVLLEILSEEALTGEMHIVGYLLDALRSAAELHTQLGHHIIINPFVGCAERNEFHHFKQMLGRDA